MKADPIRHPGEPLSGWRNFFSSRRNGWLALGFLSFSVLLIAFPQFPFMEETTPASKFFRIEASQYAFTPGELKVNPGDQVTLELVSTDVVHGFYLDGYDISVQADPGQPARLSFIADRSGTFRFRCNVTCGGMHPFMIGRLTVGVNPWLYQGFGLVLLAMAGILITTRRSDKMIRVNNDRPS
jgi:heme/copper-type cytochrome/quinol oxidase subunit 2